VNLHFTELLLKLRFASIENPLLERTYAVSKEKLYKDKWGRGLAHDRNRDAMMGVPYIGLNFCGD